ncbi:hypothetical protein BCD64_26650 [Nostoc sp. MBR 210]|nr:hypothetical protein BCD64_26650 [Nostoc sp. MBR 210]
MKSAELKVLSAELKDCPHFDKLSASQGAGYQPSPDYKIPPRHLLHLGRGIYRVRKCFLPLFLTQHSALSTQYGKYFDCVKFASKPLQFA